MGLASHTKKKKDPAKAQEPEILKTDPIDDSQEMKNEVLEEEKFDN